LLTPMCKKWRAVPRGRWWGRWWCAPACLAKPFRVKTNVVESNPKVVCGNRVAARCHAAAALLPTVYWRCVYAKCKMLWSAAYACMPAKGVQRDAARVGDARNVTMSTNRPHEIERVTEKIDRQERQRRGEERGGGRSP